MFNFHKHYFNEHFDKSEEDTLKLLSLFKLKKLYILNKYLSIFNSELTRIFDNKINIPLYDSSLDTASTTIHYEFFKILKTRNDLEFMFNKHPNIRNFLFNHWTTCDLSQMTGEILRKKENKKD